MLKQRAELRVALDGRADLRAAAAVYRLAWRCQNIYPCGIRRQRFFERVRDNGDLGSRKGGGKMKVPRLLEARALRRGELRMHQNWHQWFVAKRCRAAPGRCACDAMRSM